MSVAGTQSSGGRARIVAFVGGGAIALRALDALHENHDVVAVVRSSSPRALGGLRRRARSALSAVRVRADDPLTLWARTHGVSTLWLERDRSERLVTQIRSLRPDVGCIATFPRKIAEPVLDSVGAMCLNAHPSLLPRHRGADPLFWTYHAGDRSGGVTVHVATGDVDGGPVVSQAQTPIGRGESAVAVHERYATMGAALLVAAVADVLTGSAGPAAQVAEGVTSAPRVVRGRSYAALDEWGVEQAWHFLKGLEERYREPFRETSGAIAEYAHVVGWEARNAEHAPGSIVPDGSGWQVWTRDGVVHLAP